MSSDCDFGTCRDPEHCRIGGTCEQAAEGAVMAKNAQRGAQTSYADGSPVVGGPFGGDQLYPWELRIMRAAAERQRRVMWRRRFAVATCVCTAVCLGLFMAGLVADNVWPSAAALVVVLPCTLVCAWWWGASRDRHV